MKTVRILLVLLITFGLFSITPTFAAEKTIDQYYMDDVDYGHGAYEQLERFLYADIIDGYEETEVYEEDGEEYEYTSILLKPENNITRAQFTKIMVNAMNLTSGEIKKTFSDVNSSAWYYNYVQIASSRGIITGKEDGTFKPNDKISRAQMAAMIYRAFNETVDFSTTGKTFKDVTQNSYAYEAVVKTAGVGIVNGYGDNFKPNNFAKRSHAVLMIDRALHLESGTAEDELSVIQTVNRNVTEELSLYSEQQNLEALEALYRETTMGYYLAYSLNSQSLLDDPEYSFGSTTMEQVGEHSSKIVSLNKHFAEVKIDNLKVHVSVKEPDMDMKFEMTLDLSGTAYLKKTEGGTWKIYNIVYDDEDYDNTLTAAMAGN
ncbi:S-layer homology domain-containing protein [Psychrobacillus sp. INOP01]|uniref:S-layer homology domain-containing protein n=1 Tax=Psychrobacillus sp. INOP01 TaxID=2829187 RepID=UPI001BAAE164|nr:S-layer homology domain-containing protein [Psychrobacillus sp. INOP01]QUG40365.1 S-layer homology domain-containing protein [Psychrobacillus sp. INOP01]